MGAAGEGGGAEEQAVMSEIRAEPRDAGARGAARRSYHAVKPGRPAASTRYIPTITLLCDG